METGCAGTGPLHHRSQGGDFGSLAALPAQGGLERQGAGMARLFLEAFIEIVKDVLQGWSGFLACASG